MAPSDITNNIYHAAVISGLVIANSMLSKILKIKTVDLNRISMKDGVMLTIDVYIAIMAKDFLIRKGILPENLNNPQ